MELPEDDVINYKMFSPKRFGLKTIDLFAITAVGQFFEAKNYHGKRVSAL